MGDPIGDVEMDMYRQVFDLAADGILVADRATRRFIAANPAICDLLGYSRAELLALSVEDIHPAEDLPKALEHFEVLAADEAMLTRDLRVKRKDGGVLYVDVNGTAMTLEGRPMLMGLFRDVTERVQTEKALRESEQRFRNIVESSPMGVYLFQLEDDDQLILIGTNAAASKMTGVDATSMHGCTIEEAFPALAATEIPEHYRQAARNGTPWYSDEVVYRDERIAGAYEVHAFQASPGRVVVMFNDVTERKHAEVERRVLEAQVQHAQKLESLGVLAGGIAHDFNNLLMGILGNADLASTALSPASPARANVEDIKRASARASDLCRQMLAYSGRGQFVIEPIDLAEIVKEMSHMLEISISKKANLTCNFADNLPAVMADATQIRQVVMNLITNASEAIGDRSGVISITTEAIECDREYLKETFLDEDLPEGVYVSLTVADSGRGMDADTLNRLFDPFFTTKFTGRGLGLAAVLGIVRGHKGAVKVYSEVGQGTTFRVYLPAIEEPATHRKEPAVPTSHWEPHGTILLADDEETVRTVAKRMLERIGFSVITADDGDEAVRLYQQHRPEIAAVILDLTMPHMDGEEAFRQLRRIDPNVRVLLSSGYNQQDVTQRFVGKGLAGFIQKPYHLNTLIERMRQILADGDR